ncbi:vomeronasal secretory protein 2-like [Phodopus roborovskii]|uniref:vomeronasal secretory protein 2-like n=1 Tax=Phodopus roborovskii TaxID=109678 RepID=UPI0021E3E62B|nr:vomeronasal secretory protein 2-like [Phodopus roborovskii]
MAKGAKSGWRVSAGVEKEQEQEQEQEEARKSLKMKSLLLTVTLFVLVAVLQAQDDLPFLSEDKNVSGTWYKKATVINLNTTKLKRPKEEFPFVVRTLEKGNIEITITAMLNGECTQEEFVLEKTKEPGQYSAFWDLYHIYIYELPVMDHYIIYSELNFKKKVYVGDLIGKDTTENHEALEDFKKFTEWKGFPQENIFVPMQTAAASQSCKS